MEFDLIVRIVSLAIGYAFGCIQTAYIVGRLVKKIDVRDYGSGNAGTSNVIRVVGKKAGLIVFVCDVLKAIAAFVVCSLIFSNSLLSTVPGAYAGMGVLLGHNFPFFLNFKGGKGIASSLGVMLVLEWRAALAVYAVGFCILMATKYISLSSLIMTLLFPLALITLGYSKEVVIIAAIMTVMAFVLHRGNIQRLLNGTERKLTLFKK